MIPEYITLAEAAKTLNLGPRKMIQAMKRRKIIDQYRLPNWRYTQQGFFKTETKAFVNGHLF
ncbi:phage antirepressor KilAC domain-containing protein [uncultured Marinobacter sp.]|uniref:phage antirepressor KilAC domain-containing protein n=1 Tax=uncultured Marinobacter sp. TaxID=187379 RepID=UPI0030D9E3B1|tara:strand:+ start:32566 stop:32751 length:186 start_codon:yes stop_codon:yes gene_type:complete